jgi:NADPH2:quinone reductase
MIAYVIREFGEPTVFKEAELPTPKVGQGEVRIRVAATSVNPVDTKIRSGMLKAIAPEMPAILHADVAGVIDAVGQGVSDFAPGDAVYACAGGVKDYQGALADFMIADANFLAPKPELLSMAEAAALPLVSITAWEGIVRAGVSAGQHVLVQGGTGGVGHIAQQLARISGARVTVTCGTAEKCAQAKELGAHEAVNYREEATEDFVKRITGGLGFDVVFDTHGGPVLDQSFAAAARDGHVAAIATRSTHDLSPLHSKGLTLHVVFMLQPLLTGHGRGVHGQILRDMAALADSGQLRPLIEPKPFTFAGVAEAHALLESGKARGKIVLTNPRFDIE